MSSRARPVYMGSSSQQSGSEALRTLPYMQVDCNNARARTYFMARSFMRLLHLEDSANDAELARNLIREAWPDCRIERVWRQADYRAALDRNDFDVILSEYTLPDFDGLSALALARAIRPEKPFVFLSGKIGEEPAVEALKCGATGYVIKNQLCHLVPVIRQALAVFEGAERRRRTEGALREPGGLLDKAQATPRFRQPQVTLRATNPGVLIIDDEPNVRRLVQVQLERAGYQVFVAESGADGVEKYHRFREKIDVVVTDMNMPDVDGAAVIAAVRNANPGQPIIILSGAMHSGGLYQGDVPGPAIEWLTKPTAAPHLIETIQRNIVRR